VTVILLCSPDMRFGRADFRVCVLQWPDRLEASMVVAPCSNGLDLSKDWDIIWEAEAEAVMVAGLDTEGSGMLLLKAS
jgi:hypothetical protein